MSCSLRNIQSALRTSKRVRSVLVLRDDALRGFEGLRSVPLLCGTPVGCLDVASESAAALGCGEALVVDVSEVGPFGCDAVRLGAQASMSAMGESLVVVVAVDAPGTLLDTLEGLPRPQEDGLSRLGELVSRAALNHRRSSDAAQVVASYLACHPRVRDVSYPGLRGDPAFEVAARTLEGGFGPRVSYRCIGEEAWRDVTLLPQDDSRDVICRLEMRLS